MSELSSAAPGNLLKRVSDALRDLPGACELYVFGSLANGTADAYSDIDLEVSTLDPARSAAALENVLTIVAPIEVDWQMPTPDDAHARTILFRGEAYYHKLDIDLRAFGQIRNGAPSIRMWCIEPTPYSEQGGAEIFCALTSGTPGHFAIDQLLGGIRYVKARKRGQYWTCWRFASAQAEWLASMLWQRSRKWVGPARKLITREYIELDAGIQDEMKRIPLMTAWDFSTPAAMDDGFCNLLERTIALTRERAEHLGEIIPFDLAASLMQFIRMELGRT